MTRPTERGVNPSGGSTTTVTAPLTAPPTELVPAISPRKTAITELTELTTERDMPSPEPSKEAVYMGFLRVVGGNKKLDGLIPLTVRESPSVEGSLIPAVRNRIRCSLREMDPLAARSTGSPNPKSEAIESPKPSVVTAPLVRFCVSDRLSSPSKCGEFTD